MNISLSLILWISLCICPIVYGNPRIIRHIPPESNKDKRSEYYLSILKLALNKTKIKYGPFQLKESQFPMFQKRAIYCLKKNKLIDVIWSVTTRKREKELLPIRIPLLKGLLGLRVFIIHKDNQKKFSSIHSLYNLKKLTSVQGHDWPDTKILTANGFKVESSPDYDGIFKMVAFKRVDYFPRGIYEPWTELKNRSGLPLIVEKNFLLLYPSPVFFFVYKKNHNLAGRIREGLNLAIKDGSFDSTFYKSRILQDALSHSNIKNRIIYRLKNPLLSPQTLKLKNHPELWYSTIRSSFSPTDTD